MHLNYFIDSVPNFMVFQHSLLSMVKEALPMRNNAKVFDIVVLAGMVVNILLAVFLILYYFDFLG